MRSTLRPRALTAPLADPPVPFEVNHLLLVSLRDDALILLTLNFCTDTHISVAYVQPPIRTRSEANSHLLPALPLLLALPSFSHFLSSTTYPPSTMRVPSSPKSRTPSPSSTRSARPYLRPLLLANRARTTLPRPPFKYNPQRARISSPRLYKVSYHLFGSLTSR